jgi:hypothetical protein
LLDESGFLIEVGSQSLVEIWSTQESNSVGNRQRLDCPLGDKFEEGLRGNLVNQMHQFFEKCLALSRKTSTNQSVAKMRSMVMGSCLILMPSAS